MTTETSTPEQQVQQQAESDLTAGFNETRGTTPVEAPAKTETTVTADAAHAETPKGTEAAEVKPFAGLTEAEITELREKVPGLEARLQSEIQKVHGKFGELTRNLKLLQQQPGRKFDAAALKRLSDPEKGFPDIAEMLAQDLSDIFGSAAVPAEEKPKAIESQTQTPDISAQIQTRVDAAVTLVREATEKKLLTFMHPNWEAKSKTPEFGEFIQSLSEAERKTVMESEDSIVAASAFTRFDEWQKAKKTQADGARKNQDKNKERLEKAITPSGDGSPPATTIDDEAALEMGFKSIRG